MESVTQTRPRRFGGGTHREKCLREEVQGPQWEEVDNYESTPNTTDAHTWRDGLDSLFSGITPRAIWCVLNWCLPALLLVSIFFTYLTWSDTLLRWMFLGFITLTVVFWALLNWVLMQVLPPEKDD